MSPSWRGTGTSWDGDAGTKGPPSLQVPGAADGGGRAPEWPAGTEERSPWHRGCQIMPPLSLQCLSQPGGSSPRLPMACPCRYQQGVARGHMVARRKARQTHKCSGVSQRGQTVRAVQAGLRCPRSTAVPPHWGGPVALCHPGNCTPLGGAEAALPACGVCGQMCWEALIPIPAPHSSASAHGPPILGVPCPHAGWQP